MPIGANCSEQLVPLKNRDRDYGSEGINLPRPVGVLGVTLGIEHLNGAPFQSGARRGAASSRRNWILLDEGSEFRGGVMGGYDAQILTVEAVDERTFRLAQPGRVLGQCLENGLEIQCGAAYHLE